MKEQNGEGAINIDSSYLMLINPKRKDANLEMVSLEFCVIR